MTKIDARWVAGFHAVGPDGTPLVPGETVIQVGANEARDSDYWEPATDEARAQLDILTAVEAAVAEATDEDTGEVDLSTLTVPKLRELLEERPDLDVPSSAKKDDIVAALQTPPPTDPPADDPPVVDGEPTDDTDGDDA